MPTIEWTNEKPKYSGFYWIRSLLEETQPVLISNEFGKEQLLVAFILDNSTYALEGLHDGYEFYGPITAPK